MQKAIQKNNPFSFLSDTKTSRQMPNPNWKNYDLEEILIINRQGKAKPSLPRFAVQLTKNILSAKSNDKVEALDLSYNKLDQLPNNLTQFHRLKTLNLSDNFIKNLDFHLLSPLEFLENLVLRNNLLYQITIIQKWTKVLRILDVSQNHIKCVPYQIGDLSNLQQLFIAHNNFMLIPYQFMFLKDNLQLLQLDWFKYSKIPLDEIISGQVQMKHFFTTLTAIFFDSEQHLTNEDGQEVQHNTYLEYAVKYSQQDNGEMSFRMSNSARQVRSSSNISDRVSQSHKCLDSSCIQQESTSCAASYKKFKKFHSKLSSNMHQAVVEEDLGVLRSFLQDDKDKLILNSLDNEGHTPLSLAIFEEKYLAARFILFSNADPNLGGGWLGSCLNLAISKLQFFLVRDLLKSGSNVKKPDIFKNEAFHYLFTVFNNNTNEAQQIGKLLLEYGASPNHRNARGFTPVHLAVSKVIESALQFANQCNLTMKEKTSKQLFQYKHKTLKDKNSCLHLAVQTRQINIVKLVLEQEPQQVFSRNAFNLLPTDYLKDDLTIFKLIVTIQRMLYRRIFKDQQFHLLQNSESFNPDEGSINYTTIQTVNDGEQLSDLDLIDQGQVDIPEPTIVSNKMLKNESQRFTLSILDEQQQLARFNRSIPVSANNIKLVQEYNNILIKGDQKSMEKKYLQGHINLIKHITYEFKNMLQFQNHYLGLLKNDNALTERLSHLIILKRIYQQLTKLISVISQDKSEILLVQWRNFLISQNQMYNQQQEVKSQRNFDELFLDTITQYSKGAKGFYSTNMIHLFTSLNKQIECLYEKFFQKGIDQFGSNQSIQISQSQSQFDRLVANMFLSNYFLSPQNSFVLQKVIIFINTKEKQELILESKQNTINQYEVLQNKQFIQLAPTNSYHIINQKLLVKTFSEKSTENNNETRNTKTNKTYS